MEVLLTGSAFWIAAGAAVFAGIAKTGFGSGPAFVASAVLALVIDPALALAIMLPVLMVIDISGLTAYWKKWDEPSVRGLTWGAVPGIALGAALISVVSDDAMRVLIGAVALAFPLFQMARMRGWVRGYGTGFNRPAALGFGALAGFTSFVSHAGGPPVTMFLLSQPNMDKTTYQSTTVVVFWAINAMKAVVYAAIGIFTLAALVASLTLMPFALLGAWIGVKAHHAVPDRAFFIFAYGLLIATGIRLIWLGLT